MERALLAVQGLKKEFDGHTVLDSIDFTVNQGEIVAVIGPSGTGKSTLLRCVNLLEIPQQGKIRIGDCEVTAPKIRIREQNELRSRTSMVFQQYNLFANKTAAQNIMEPLIQVKKMKKEEAREFAVELLQSIGLKKKADEYPSKMSGGEQQRVGILRAAATNPQLMLLDEPTSSLDPELVGEVQQVILSLTAQRMTMLLTTHEMNFAKRVASKVLFLSDGKIGEQGTPEQIFDNPQTERLKTFLNHYRGRKIL